MKFNEISTTHFFFDKLTVTLPVPEDQRLTIRNQFDIVRKWLKSKDTTVKPYSGKKERYNNVLHMEIPTDTKKGYFTIRFFIFPINKKNNFFKLEFNPSQMGTKGHLKLRKILIKLLGTERARQLFYEGRITRQDITIEKLLIDSEFRIYKKGCNISELYTNDSGNVTSQVAGSGKSETRVTFYDKDHEQGLDVDDSSRDCRYRLEIRIKESGFAIADIEAQLKNYFKNISFYDDKFIYDQDFDEEFRNIAFSRGLNSAFNKLDTNLRRRYLRHLQKYECDPFEVNKIRKSSLKQALKVFNFLKSRNYQSHEIT